MEIEGLSGLEGMELIQDTFLFQLLNFDESLALANLFRKEPRRKGDTIIEEGALGQALYLIQQGRVTVYKGEGEDREKIADLGAGELFGEMSLIENELTSATVVAASDVALLTIRRDDFENLLARDQNIALKIYRTFCNTLSERLRRTSQELQQLKAQQGHEPNEPAPRKAAKASRPAPARKRSTAAALSQSKKLKVKSKK
jgi:CRP-like cAMP-binding protein